MLFSSLKLKVERLHTMRIFTVIGDGSLNLSLPKTEIINRVTYTGPKTKEKKHATLKTFRIVNFYHNKSVENNTDLLPDQCDRRFCL